MESSAETRRLVTMLSIGGGFAGSMIHEGVRQSFVEAWKAWIPTCNLSFFVIFNILMFSAYFTCKFIFARSCMPRWLKDDPAIMSYTIVATVPVFLCAYLGVTCIWNFWLDPNHGSTLQQRMTHYSGDGTAIAHIHAAYQFWNLMMSLMRREGAVAIVHHTSCLLLGLLNTSCFGCYHMIYIGGAAEVSTLVLTVMDIFKLNPYLQEKYPLANLIVRASFCTAFLLFRVVFWFVVLFSFFRDMYDFGRESGDFRNPHVHIAANVAAMVMLTVIQLIWAQLVVRGILKVTGLIVDEYGPATIPSQDRKRANAAKEGSNSSEGSGRLRDY